MKPTILPFHHPTIPKIIFFGSSKYSVIDAEKLHHKYGLLAIVTTPDKPKGRKKELIPAPTKKFALENKIKVFTPQKLDELFLSEIQLLNPDFLVVADYGQILPKKLLKIPKYEALNVHQSLLPKYRGPSPAPAAILAGEKETGVTIIKMTEEVDAGPIYAQEKYQLKTNETTDSLLTQLNTIGGQLVCLVIGRLTHPRGGVKISAGEHPGGVPRKQNESEVTYTRRFTKQDGYIDPKSPPDPQILDRMIRAYYPWPAVWTELETRNMKHETRKVRIKLLPNLSTILPSYIPTDPFIIQPEGKNPMTQKEFLNGYPQARRILEKLF